MKRNQGEWYVNSPYALIWNEDRYYLIGYSDKRKKVVTFRVDRMCMPKILEEKSVPMPSHFHVMDYANKTFKMFDGEEQTIILECKKHVMKNLIDEFGVDIEVELISEDMFRATVTAVISKTFFGWLFTYAGEINLIGPEKVRQEYHQRIHIALHDTIKEDN